jgi:hypothetical protein
MTEYAVEIASGGMISLMIIGSGIRVILTSTVSEVAMLVLLMRGIYYVRH